MGSPHTSEPRGGAGSQGRPCWPCGPLPQPSLHPTSEGRSEPHAEAGGGARLSREQLARRCTDRVPGPGGRPPACLTYCPGAPYKIGCASFLCYGWGDRGGLSQAQGLKAEISAWDWTASGLAPEAPRSWALPRTTPPPAPFLRTLRPQRASWQPDQSSQLSISCPEPSSPHPAPVRSRREPLGLK